MTVPPPPPVVARGQVYRVPIRMQDRTPGATPGATVVRNKLHVVLQGGPNFDTLDEVGVVIASSLRGSGDRPFEVVVGTADGFHHDTVVDCRWVFTRPKAMLVSGDLVTTLSPGRMTEVSYALREGLQLTL